MTSRDQHVTSQTGHVTYDSDYSEDDDFFDDDLRPVKGANSVKWVTGGSFIQGSIIIGIVWWNLICN